MSRDLVTDWGLMLRIAEALESIADSLIELELGKILKED